MANLIRRHHNLVEVVSGFERSQQQRWVGATG